MATFRKVEIVEAEKYEGAPLTVMHDHLGEQKAQPGDWLLGTERGKIRVMSARQFEAEFKPIETSALGYFELTDSSAAPPPPSPETLKISELTAQIADMNVSRENLRAELKDARAEIASLKKQISANTEVLREHPVKSAKTAAKKK